MTGVALGQAKSSYPEPRPPFPHLSTRRLRTDTHAASMASLNLIYASMR